MLLVNELAHVEDLCREIFADINPAEVLEILVEIFNMP